MITPKPVGSVSGAQLSTETDGLSRPIFGHRIEDIFQQIRAYDWNKDTEFQEALEGILANTSRVSADPSVDIEETKRVTTLECQCYYWATLKHKVDVDAKLYSFWYDSCDPVRSGKRTPNNRELKAMLDAYPPSPPTQTLAQGTTQITSEATQEQTRAKSIDIETLESEPKHMEKEHYPSSFNDVVNMIQSGQPVPGIREILPKVLPEQASLATTPQRPKPWERNQSNQSCR